jgi:excinuclease ABC subunit A
MAISPLLYKFKRNPMKQTGFIKIKGAREHNLQNVSLDIPKDKFVVITGVSGSGKSSLAFDTIYAEGQRRYVESLSAYARQFLGIMDKPDVDSIEGLSPSISIDQKSASRNPRSTVGTITEIYDFLRLLFARIGRPHCPNDKIEITKLSTDEIIDRIMGAMEKLTSSKKKEVFQFSIFSPVVRQKKGEFRDLFENLRNKGFLRARIDGEEREILSDISLNKTYKHTIDVVIDSLPLSYRDFTNNSFRDTLRSRLSSAVEQGTALSQGLIILKHEKTETLYSEKFSCPICGFSLPEIEPRLFSFNSPIGACERCKGIGTIYKADPDAVLNKNLTINEGGITPFAKYFYADTWYSRLIKQVAVEEGIDTNIPLGEMEQRQIDILLNGTDKTYEVRGTNRFGKPTAIRETFEGVLREIEKRSSENSISAESFETQKFMKEEICDICQGKKLKPEVLAVTIDKKNISEFSDMPVEELIPYFKKSLPEKLNAYESQIAKPISKEVETRMDFLRNVGLSYLTISRAARTLSGGELQRIRLASQIGSGLTGVLYVLDEPSIGLHPRDVSALINALHELKDLGNTLLVVEHDQETIESAEHIVELGPQAGKHGGKVTFEGTVEKMKRSKDSLTGQYLSGKKTIRIDHLPFNKTKGELVLKGASQNNLKNVTANFPLGNLIAVTGVSGSGKSTLVVDTLYPALKYYLDGHFSEQIGEFKDLEGYSAIRRVYLVDQSPIGRTPRSNPSTYVGFFDDIRDIYATTLDAKAKGFQKGRFSFNLKGGRCEKCQGAGVIKIEMQFLPDMYVTCDVCEGRRYNKETLEIKYRDKSIDEVLAMTVDEASGFFRHHPAIYQKLATLQGVGLGYIGLGQPATTFSGGEAQRMKLANELSHREAGNTLYILDEPTTGLHFYDIQKLLHALRQLVERGNTVVIIEHNLDVIKNCQYVIDLGPEGGDRGGNIVYQGELSDLLKNSHSHTAKYLKKHLKRD